MNKNNKNMTITGTVIISFLIAFAIVFVFLNWYVNNYDIKKWENEFFNQQFELNQKKIILVGASQVGQLNSTLIQNILLENDRNYVIYNLAVAADRPSLRIHTIDKIISIKPDLVLYGIGLRDFEKIDFQAKPESILPYPEYLFQDYVFFTEELDFLKKSRFYTLRFLSTFLPDSIISNHEFDDNNPFFTVSNKHREIIEQKSIIETHYFEPFGGIEASNNDRDVKALSIITQKLINAGIPLIIFSTPHPQIYFDNVSHLDKEKFEVILDEFSQYPGVQVVEFHEKYKDHEIWTDYTHVAFHENTKFFSEDLAKIILEELDT